MKKILWELKNVSRGRHQSKGCRTKCHMKLSAALSKMSHHTWM